MRDRDRDPTPTVIPAEPGWWAIHADRAAGESERHWFASRVAAWLVDAGRRRHDGEPIASATPILGSVGEGYLSDCDGVLALVHESEMAPDLRAALPWLTATRLEQDARKHLASEREWQARLAQKRAAEASTRGAA